MYELGTVETRDDIMVETALKFSYAALLLCQSAGAFLLFYLRGWRAEENYVRLYSPVTSENLGENKAFIKCPQLVC